jgi:hypothetical protein
MTTLALDSNIILRSGTVFSLCQNRVSKSFELGYKMPRLGFGVYKNYTTTASVVEALEVGYRRVISHRSLA